jgi:hypothetical protein
MTPAREPGSPLTVLPAPPEGGAPVPDPMAGGPGLYEVTEPDGTRWITNLTRKVGDRETPPGRRLVNTAAVLLGLLDAGLFAVSLAAQYQYIFHAKHQSWPAIIEAVALDAGMVIFSLLALGLARGRQSAPVERALIVVCALGSAAMNYGAADVSSARSVAAYVMPPVFLAIVTDRVIAVVRRHMLGMEAERSAWAVIGRLALAVLAAAGKTVLYGLRLVLAPRSTLSGARTLVLIATPLPGTAAVALALDPVRAALDEDLRELRGRYELTAANLDDSLRAAQEASRTEIGSVRETVRTEITAVREAARTEAGDAAREALGAVRAALGADLRELRERHEQTATLLADGLSATRKELRTEIDSVRETVRTEVQAVRDAVRTQAAEPPPVDRDAVVAGLADEIRDAVRSGEQWAPDYDALMTRTGYRRSWCEKAVRDARTAVLETPGTTSTTDGSPS